MSVAIKNQRITWFGLKGVPCQKLMVGLRGSRKLLGLAIVLD